VPGPVLGRPVHTQSTVWLSLGLKIL
jgi:hypothetical protein